ncbi:SRPBCC family protein [Algirhabdus cladophorae]|uniref:SRPBCC family protein n=1 Tax=Algirhabdus cladophorae TaxID=3377108 RepID=UPI003B84637E
MKTIHSTHYYDVPPERLWALVTDFGALEYVMKGLIAFKGAPQGRTFTGQKADVQVSVMGLLPYQDYTMEVILCDDDAMQMNSSEKGAGVKSWRHSLQVVADGQGARLHDTIEIDAGLMTPIFAAWARYMYRARHKPRLKLFADGVF